MSSDDYLLNLEDLLEKTENELALLHQEKKRLETECERLQAIVQQVDDVLIVNWICPRVDGDYRKALADLVTNNLVEHEYFSKEEKAERDYLRQRVTELEAVLKGLLADCDTDPERLSVINAETALAEREPDGGA